MTPADIRTAALALPPEDRAKLRADLVASLPPPATPTAADREAARKIADVHNDVNYALRQQLSDAILGEITRARAEEREATAEMCAKAAVAPAAWTPLYDRVLAAGKADR